MKGFFKNEMTGVYTESLSIKETFIDISAYFAHMPGTVLLMSGGDLDSSRYNILGLKPWLTYKGKGSEQTVTTAKGIYKFNDNPFSMLKKLVTAYDLSGFDIPGFDLYGPVAAGLFGYLAYDLKDFMEDLPKTSVDDLLLPDICFFAPSIILIHDKIKKQTRLHVPEFEDTAQNNTKHTIEWFFSIINSGLKASEGFMGNLKGFESNFKKTDYIDSIQRIKEYITQGHVYQVNMSQRFIMDFSGDTFSLFQELFKNNPASFFAYINAGDHCIISTSPERFILQTDNMVETRPIKGTMPRGKNLKQDRDMKKELEQSIKDDAELSMIVDLLRNDLGKVCRAGSVKVTKHKVLEAYSNVYHMVSVVKGELDPEVDSTDIIKAAFPGGSITGCPKVRAMEIIDELEPTRRHIYTGSIGYISFHDTMDLSIAIRTATVLNGKIIFSVGGGVVFDSNPEDEFEETLHKGKTLMEVFQGKGKKEDSDSYIWFNGKMAKNQNACVSVSDPGFQYGAGFFETIRVSRGKPQYLKEHMTRFNLAWEDLFGKKAPDLTWNDIISSVIVKNSLEDKISAVKIIATSGDRDEAPFNNALIVMARPYIHRLSGKKEHGLNLVVYPEPRQTPLADYKTLNYFYYYRAGKWAASKGADEALIVNPDGTVSETNTGNILILRNKTVLLPYSDHMLKGVMQDKVCAFLENNGFKIEKKRMTYKDLFKGSLLIITNSLMGAVPVLSINGQKTGMPSNFWQEINNKVL